MIIHDDGGDVVEDQFHQVSGEAKTGFSQLSLSQVFFYHFLHHLIKVIKLVTVIILFTIVIVCSTTSSTSSKSSSTPSPPHSLCVPPPDQSHPKHHHQHSHHVFHHSTSGSVEFPISRSRRPCSILLAPFPAAFRRWALSHYTSL